MMPRVTALIINYNYGRFLGEAIESVLAQTFSDYELVIADDGSTDDSEHIARSFESSGVRFVSGPHVGLAPNLARGIASTDGELLAFLSADDRWLAGHLTDGIAALRKYPEAALSYAYLVPIDEPGNRIEVGQTLKQAVARSGWVDPMDVLPHNFIYTQTALLRREALDAIGGIDTTLAFTELDLFARLVRHYPIVHTGKASVEYRVHRDSLNHDYEFTLRSRLAVYDKHFGDRASKEKSKLVARAYLKTAYRELADDPAASTVRAARSHLLKGLLRYPRAARPLELVLIPALVSPRLFVFMNDRYRSRLRNSAMKVRLQRLLRVAR
jgi:glycosyltransferase involved in cell wall biosynthesis